MVSELTISEQYYKNSREDYEIIITYIIIVLV